jgi:predicted dehydrogenase
MKKLVLVDSDEARAQQMAAKFKASNWRCDYRKLLGKVDGAIIAAPTNFHYSLAMEFLSRGTPVLCEKPLAETVSQAREMVETAAQNNAVLAVNYLQRLIPTFAKVKEWLNEKTYGEPRFIEYIVREKFDWPSVSGFYFNSPISARGVLRDRGSHVLDHICWWLGGKPKVISSQYDSYGGSEAVAAIKFDHGNCSGEVKLSWLVKFPSRYKIICETATIRGDVYDYQNMTLESREGPRRGISLKTGLKTKLDIARTIVENFIDILRKGSQPLIPGHEVLASLEFADECYAAAKRFDMPWYEIPEGQHE